MTPTEVPQRRPRRALVYCGPTSSWTPPADTDDIVPKTPESLALSKALKRQGFAFVGPTTMHALMEAIGLVDDHLVGCHRSATP